MSVVDDRLRLIREAEESLREALERSHDGGGSGSSGGMSDDWKASVDTQLGQLHQDVRNLLYGLLGAAVLLLGALVTGYLKLSDQAIALQTGPVASLQTEMGKQAVRMDSVEKHLDSIDAKLDKLLEAKRGR